LGEGTTLELDAGDLRTAIERVAFGAATDDSRPVLTGIHTSLQGDTMTLAAADGFRLAVQTLHLSQPVAEKLEVIIPARWLRELDRLLADQEDPVTMMVNRQRSQVLFQLKNVEMVSQLLQGAFPNYRQLIPESSSTKAVLEVADFLRATRTAAIFARDGNGVVRLYMTPGEEAMAGSLRLASRSEEVGENEGTIDALVEGPAAQIAFNSRYLTDVLAVLGKGRVSLEVSSPSSPGVLRLVDSDTYLHVVMPMFVQW
jgi:DNA polymerase-3 subunit beta